MTEITLVDNVHVLIKNEKGEIQKDDDGNWLVMDTEGIFVYNQ